MRTAEELIDDLEAFAIDSKWAILIVEFDGEKTSIAANDPDRLAVLREYMQDGVRPIVMAKYGWDPRTNIFHVNIRALPEAIDDPEVLAFCHVNLEHAVREVFRLDVEGSSIDPDPDR